MIMTHNLLAIEAMLIQVTLFWQINEGLTAPFAFKNNWQVIDQWRANISPIFRLKTRQADTVFSVVPVQNVY